MNKLKKFQNIFLVLLIIISVNHMKIEATSQRFSDVPVSNSFYDYIYDLYSDGIIKGYEDGTFRPNNQLTRAQAAKMIVEAAGINTKGVNSNFKDVPKKTAPNKLTSFDYISAAFEAGIISGYDDGTFRPNTPVTRAQIAKMITLAFDLEKVGNPAEFKDVEKLSSANSREYIYILSSNDIVKGYGDEFRPRNNVTRGQFSKIVSIAMDVNHQEPDVKIYTITIDDSSYNYSINVKHGDNVTLPQPKGKEGYTFIGWSHDGKNITSDLTIRALYEKNKEDLLNGLVRIDGYTYYYINDVKQKGLQIINGHEYYFSIWSGIMQTGDVEVSDGVHYYFNENGIREHGFKEMYGSTYYYSETQGLISNQFYDINSQTYYFGEYGRMVTGMSYIKEKDAYFFFDNKGVLQIGLVDYNNTKIYIDKETGRAENEFVNINGNLYYFYDNGYMAKLWIKVDGKRYYLNNNGIVQHGLTTIDGVDYFFDETTGEIYIGFKEINHKVYYFTEGGSLKGEQTIGNDDYYFLEDGAMQTGFVRMIKGNQTYTYYFDPKSGKKYYGPQKIDNHDYYFIPKVSYTRYDEGNMVTSDWVETHYYDKNGQRIKTSKIKEINEIKDLDLNYNSYNEYLSYKNYEFGFFGNHSHTELINYYIQDNTFNVLRFENGQLLINQFNTDMKQINTKTVSLPYDLFGGFHQDENGNFYVLSGQDNFEKDDEKIVIQVIKYDKNWNNLGSFNFPGSLKIAKPFYAGKTSMDSKNGTLTFHTSILEYADSNGINHQSSISYSIDTNTMLIKSGDKYLDVPFVSHSFNQFVRNTGNHLIYIDHGDGFPMRSVLAYKGGSFGGANLIDIDGNDGNNYTGLVLTGFELGSTKGLITGASKPHQNPVQGVTGFARDLKNNIYLVTFDHDLKNKKHTWITNYHPQTDTTIVAEPKLLKVNNNRFILMYSEKYNDDYRLAYLVLDENGTILRQDYYPGYILTGSSEPIIFNNKIVWLNSQTEFSTNKHKTYLTEIPLLMP